MSLDLRSALASAALAVSCAAPARAAVLLYQDAGAYAAAMPGVTAIHDSLDDLPTNATLAGPLQRNLSALGYRTSAVEAGGSEAGAFFPLDDGLGGAILSTDVASSAIRLDKFSATMRGIGGIFFGSDLFGAAAPGTVRLDVTDGSGTYSYQFNDLGSDAFLGFVSDSRITALSFAALNGADPLAVPLLFPSIGDLDFGALPEPAGLALFGAAFALAMLRWRQGAKAQR